MAFRNEKVIGAARYDRPKESSVQLATHAGVVVNTDQNNSYLIHNTPGSGVVATSADNMSKNWTKTRDIPVIGHKTVGDALMGGYTTGSGRLGKLGEYLFSGTCQWTADGVETALKRPN